MLPSFYFLLSHLTIGRAEIDFCARSQLDRLPGRNLAPEPLETASQAELKGW